MADEFPVLQQLLSRNAQWAEDVEKADPGFSKRSVIGGQHPHALWIGCADSRVPESVITNSRPGDIFVHRNIANQLPLEDVNALSVLEYAVHYLGTRHVIIVGHSECGGVSASLKAVQSGYNPDQTLPEYPPNHPLNRWLAPLTEFIATLDISSKSFADALPIAVEANVTRQVERLSETRFTKADEKVWIHGWVYELAVGELRDLGISRRAAE